MPRNFNPVMNKLIRLYTKFEEIRQIGRLYEKYQKDIKPRSDKDLPDEDEDQPQTDTDSSKEDDQPVNKKPSKKNPRDNGNKNKNKPQNPRKNRWGPEEDDKSEETRETSDDSNKPDEEEDSPSNKKPRDETETEGQSDDDDTVDKESVNPKKSDTKNTNKNFKKEKNELKTKRIIDNETSYTQKRSLLIEINSFKKYQSKRNLMRFKKLFKFEIRTERLFRFIKHCYRYKKMPRNFNPVMNKIIRLYTKFEEIRQIDRLYEKYQEEIKPRSVPDEDEDQPQTDTDSSKEDDQPVSKKPSKNNPRDSGNKNKNKPQNPRKNRGEEGDDDNSEEMRETSDDSNKPDKGDESPNNKKPRDGTGTEGQNDDDDTDNKESVNPKKSDTKNNNKNFKKEKNELKTKKITDNETSYRQKRDLLIKINSFENYKSKRNLLRFKKLFKFEIRTERLFKFIKHCYRFKKMPRNFNIVMNKIIRIYTKFEEIREIDRLYKKYQREIRPRSGKDFPDEDKDQSETDDGIPEGQIAKNKPSKSVPGDNENRDKNKSGKPETNKGKGEDYVPEEPEKSTDGSSQQGNEDDINSKNNKVEEEKESGETEEDEPGNSENREDDEEKFILEKSDLKSLKISDNEDSYEEKSDLLKIMTFDQYQSKRYVKRIFKFRIRTRRFFNFIKHCYHFQKIPRNHNEVINKVLKMYSYLRESKEIYKLYKVYDKEIKPRSQRNVWNGDVYETETDEENGLPYKRPYQGTPEDNGSEGKNKPIKQQKGVGKTKEDESGNKPGGQKNSEENIPKGKPRKPSTTGDSKITGSSPNYSNKGNEAVGLINNRGRGKNTPGNSQRGNAQFSIIQDSEKTYITKHLFLRYLTFQQYNIPKNVHKLYKLFGFKIRTKLVFTFIKHCYRFNRMPKNHNRALNKLLSILKILRPNTLHKYLQFFLKKYDEWVTLYSNENSSNSAIIRNDYQNSDVKANNKGADEKSFSRVYPIFKPNRVLKDRPSYNRGNVPRGDAKQGKDSPKSEDGSEVEHFFGNDQENELGNNNQGTKTNNPQTGSGINNWNPQYFNSQLGSGYGSYENVNRIITNNNQQIRNTFETSQNNIQNNDNNNFQVVSSPYDLNQQLNRYSYTYKNPLTDSVPTSGNQQPNFDTNFNLQGSNINSNLLNFNMDDNSNLQNQAVNNYQMNYITSDSNQQYDENQSESQKNMQYDSINSQTNSMSTSMNQQSNSNTNFNVQGTGENQNLIPFGTFDSQSQNSNSYQTNSITYDSTDQYDKIQSDSQNNINYDYVNLLRDSSPMTMNQQPSFDQSASGYNYQNYYTNDLQENSVTGNTDQNQFSYQYNSFQNGLESSAQDGSQNSMQDVIINNPQIDNGLYSNINQQYADSQTASSYSTQNNNFQFDSLPYEQNLQNDVVQTENTDFSTSNQQYSYVNDHEILQNQPFFEDGSE